MPTTNSTIQFKHGLQEAFSNITKDSNTIYFITDANRLFVGDSEYSRPVQHGSELPTSKNPANSLFVKEAGAARELYYSKDGTAWDMITYLPATITGGVFGDNTAGTVAYGGTVKVPKVTVDNRGYVTAAEDVTITLPISDKVTTVTSNGDGNAVTSGSISNDGTTLTLTKGESFVPASGGTFSGDVVVNGYLTADSIKTSRNINITSTHKQGNDGDHDVHHKTTINFINTGVSTNEIPIKIEADYDLVTEAYSSTYSSLSTFSDEVSITGKTIRIGNYPYSYTFISGVLELNNYPSDDFEAATKGYVDNAIASAISASDAMVFKGTVGTSGTASSFSAINVSSATNGDTYKVITADTLPAASSFDSAAHDLTPGDLIVYMGDSKFIYVPSGDEDVTSIKVAGSGDTINVSTTAQTGTVVLGDVATKKASTSTTLNGNGASNNNVPTELAVKTYVDDTVGALENTLGTAATTDATDYATAAQGTKADNAMPKSGGTFTGAVTLAGAPTTDLNAATKKYVDDSVSGVTDTKVTTVTTTGDGNAVTSGSISNDGTTLTLTKGTSFVPSTGGTFSGDITVSGNLTADDIKTSGEINITPNDNETTVDVQFLNGGDSFDNDTTVSIESEYVPHSPAPGVPANSNKTYLKLNSDVTQINSDTTEITGALNVSGQINKLDIESENQNNVYTCTISAGVSAYVEFERANGYHNLKLNADDNIDLDASNINLNGNVTLSSVPSNNMHAATKKYVDDAVTAATLTWKTF